MCGCGPGQWECHPVACAELQWKVLSLKVRSRARALSRTLRAVRLRPSAELSFAHTTRGGASHTASVAWSDSVKWGDRQRRQGYYKWPTHRHRAEHHASWDTVWKTQGQGEAQGGGQGEQDPHRWGQIWHEGCLGNVSTSHQDLINAIVMAANRVLAGTWQHINTCTAAKSVINMHIWTPCKSLQFALRLSLCKALLVSIIVKREVKGPSWWLTPWLLKLLTSCFWRKLTAMPTLWQLQVNPRLGLVTWEAEFLGFYSFSGKQLQASVSARQRML